MERCDSIPLIFKCNEIHVTDRDYWDEIIQLTFLSVEGENISFTRLSYDDEIYIEYNDQTNYLYSFYENVDFILRETTLNVNVKPKKQKNMSNVIEIVFNSKNDDLEKILYALKTPPICISM